MLIDDSDINSIDAKNWTIEKQNNRILLKGQGSSFIQLEDKNGNKIELVFLSRDEAQQSWRTKINGKELLLISSADIIFGSEKINLLQLNNNRFDVKIYPSDFNAITSAKPIKKGIFDEYSFTTKRYSPEIKISGLAKNKADVTLPSSLPYNVEDVFLKIDYLGGGCKLYQNNELYTDHLVNGEAWMIGTKRFIEKGKIILHIEDWDNKITGVPQALVNKIKKKGSMFHSATNVVQYKISIN